jgi:glycosyltransferase involved in cell wall biosynthesis
MVAYTILHTESSTGWGGQEIRVLTESAGMIRRGHKVLLACQPNSIIARRASDYGIKTIIIRMNGAFDIVGITRLRALMLKEKVNIVNTHSSKDSWCAGLAAKLAGSVKIVRSRHLSIPIKRSFESRLLYNTIPDAIVTTGKAIREHIIEQIGVSPEKVVSIPTGIDLGLFDPSRADRMRFRKELGLTDDTPLVGTVAMLRRMKGLEYFVEAAKIVLATLPKAHFVIVGDVAFKSSIKERLTAQIRSLGILDKVTMVGYREDIPDVMAALDVFVLASVEHEGVPQVISQALAMEKPVVATDTGSIREQIIHGETGYLVDKANPQQLAAAVLMAFEDANKSQEMGRNGRRLVEKYFSLDSMLDATEALYSRLLLNT